MVWEYMLITSESYGKIVSTQQLGEAKTTSKVDLLDMLNSYGESGWEATGLTQNDYGSKTVLMKRMKKGF